MLEEIQQATPAAMTQQSAPDTHVTVHTESVSLLHRLLTDVEHGVEGAIAELGVVFRHVFHR